MKGVSGSKRMGGYGSDSELRLEYLAQDKKLIQWFLVTWAVIALVAIFFDFQDLGFSSPFFGLLLMRAAYICLTVLVIYHLRVKVAAPETCDSLTILWGLITALGIVAISWLIPVRSDSIFLIDLVAVACFYALLPSRPLVRGGPALILTLNVFYMLVRHNHPLTSQFALGVIFCFCVTNLVGLYLAWYNIAQRRKEYRARLEERKIRQDLQDQAATDPLTGIFNRRRLMEIASDTFDRYQHSGRIFSVMLMDLDSFKQINETFGHQQGDDTLVEFARLVSSEKRECDAFGRVGGDEFCLLLPDTSGADAIHLAERIIRRCGEITVNKSRALSLRVSVSIGIAQVHPAELSLDRLFVRVDGALNEAKIRGKNRWVDGQQVVY